MHQDTNILLVEDNPGDARLIREMLKDTEYASANVMMATTLKEAVERPLEESVTLILLDLSLPDSSGIDSVNAILKRYPDSALIILTGLNDQEIALNAIKSGVENYLVKGEISEKSLERDIRYSIERHNIRNNLARITNELSRQNKDLQQFAYIISHNLRAPVAKIMGLSDLLQDSIIEDNEKTELIGELNQAVKNIDTVIVDLNKILDTKKVVNDKKERVSFTEMVNEVKETSRSMHPPEGVKIETDFSAIDEFSTIKSYLHSIFYNLITNSIKYRQHSKPVHITIKSAREGNRLQLVFKDNGLGIDMKRRGEQVFGLYKRFHPDIEGKGMGLFMVKTQVEALGGRVHITSEPNVGTEFTIVLEM